MKIASSVWASLLLVSTGFVACSSQMLAQDPAGEQTVKNEALQATMKADGTYELDFLATGWKLEGKFPGKPGDLHVADGSDAIGRYHEVSANTKQRAERIRLYDALPVALFRDQRKTKDSDNVDPFPTFRSLPQGLSRFSFQQRNFGLYEFGKLGPEGPWILFDKQSHAMILSPADHFLVASLEQLPDGSVDSRIVPTIQRMPLGFTHDTLIATGTGIQQVFATWGSALLALGGKPRPANNADVTLAKLGYWTDNKTAYYYKFDPSLGYAGTLLAVRDEFRRLGVPLGYMQLDSWFYPKGPLNRWDTLGDGLEFGENEYRADKTLFPDGLDAFHQALGLPMVTHARWVSPQSPYRTQYRMSGNVVIDPRFWTATADYLHNAGVVTYEQDWLDENAHAMPNLTEPQMFLGDMAKAMAADGMSVQYCMPLPSDYMASTLYPSVQTIRTSGDGFERSKWDTFLYDSQMASALGVWPWTDAFFSNDLGNLIISTLSAGPVGVGDAIGQVNVKNLMAVVRADGAIIKPDTPLLPIDATYQSDAIGRRAPMVAAATTSFGDLRYQYVFAYPRTASDTQVTVSLHDLGVSGPVFAYNWQTHQGELIPANGSLTMEFNDGWAYQVLAPLSPDGIALLGDTAKITPMGRARFAAVQQNQGLTTTVAFSQKEGPQTLSGYAARPPRVKALSGKVQDFHYDAAAHIFTVSVVPGESRQAELQILAR